MGEAFGVLVLESLRDCGVKRVYGCSGDDVLGASRRLSGLDLIAVGDGETAACSAVAHAELTDEVGVCLTTSGCEAIGLLHGLYEAERDRRPVVAIVGQPVRRSLADAHRQGANLAALFKAIAGEFVEVCEDPAQARPLIARAVQNAAATRSPTCVIVPYDSEQGERAAPPHGPVFDQLSGRLPDGSILTRISRLIATKLVFPDRPVIAVAGGREMQRKGVNELIMVQHHRERWRNQTLVVLVLHDSRVQPDFEYAQYADLIGMHAVRVGGSTHFGEAWDEVLSIGRPALLEVVTEAETPPPPRRFDRAKVRRAGASMVLAAAFAEFISAASLL